MSHGAIQKIKVASFFWNSVVRSFEILPQAGYFVHLRSIFTGRTRHDISGNAPRHHSSSLPYKPEIVREKRLLNDPFCAEP